MTKDENPEAFDAFIASSDALFHYTKLSIAIEKVLAEKRLRLSVGTARILTHPTAGN